MTVKELKEVLETLDPATEVFYTNYGNISVNGWYVDNKNDRSAVILTDLYVQPRNA